MISGVYHNIISLILRVLFSEIIFIGRFLIYSGLSSKLVFIGLANISFLILYAYINRNLRAEYPDCAQVLNF
jgi:hypothetical protein